MESKARQLHAKALELREKKDFLEALKIGEEALNEYQKENDIAGFGEMLGMHAKTYLHLYDFTNFEPYLNLSTHLALTSVETVEKFGDISATILPLYDLGKIYEDAGDLENAIRAYKKSIDRMQSNPSPRHSRKSVLANMKVHLHTTEYRNGDQGALARAEEAVSDLEKSDDANEYEKNVWLSGAHMRIARMLAKYNPQKAREHLNKAKEIIDSDPKLVIRKDQWEKLLKELTI